MTDKNNRNLHKDPCPICGILVRYIEIKPDTCNHCLHKRKRCMSIIMTLEAGVPEKYMRIVANRFIFNDRSLFGGWNRWAERKEAGLKDRVNDKIWKAVLMEMADSEEPEGDERK